ncbi:MAG: AhpC/TSA family protein, partial [Gammaproteobacteria bacterium]|nr:AhpC/TSA family protein [Gammaproteobacteria bacterium]
MSQPLETSVTLADKLQTLVQDFISQLPADAQQTVGQSFERLLTSNTGANAIQEGDKAPDFVLPGVNGNPVQLGKLLEKGPVVLSFYRGGWCPFCSLEFKALINILPQIQSLGAQLIGVSPETQDTSAKTVRDHSIPFEVLSDQGNVVARDYG